MNDWFSSEGFARLLRQVRDQGYVFRTIDEDAPDAAGDRTFYLRHDVDLSARAAWTLGSIAHEHGVRSSFFFLLGADTYNLLDRPNLEIVQELRTLGHRVGLHLDERLVRHDERLVRETVDWFDHCITPIDPIVSFHRPTPDVLGRGYESFHSAYRPSIFSPDRYLSDSRRSDAFRQTLDGWLAEGRTPIQLLLHPGWWIAVSGVAEFREILLRRRLAEVKRYLGDNFGKVFGKTAEEDEDRSLGL